jgi:hypothetical protein
VPAPLPHSPTVQMTVPKLVEYWAHAAGSSRSPDVTRSEHEGTTDVVLAEAVSLPGLPSVSIVDTEAWSTIVPTTWTEATIVTTEEAPAARLPRAQVTTRPLLVQRPAGAEETNVVPAGRVSSSVTPVIVALPSLRTVTA